MPGSGREQAVEQGWWCPSSPSATAATRYGVVNHYSEAPSVARLNALVEAELRAAGITVPGR